MSQITIVIFCEGEKYVGWGVEVIILCMQVVADIALALMILLIFLLMLQQLLLSLLNQRQVEKHSL